MYFSINPHNDGVKLVSKDGSHGHICLCCYTNRTECDVSFKSQLQVPASDFIPVGTHQTTVHGTVYLHFIGFVHNLVLNEEKLLKQYGFH